MAKKSVTNRKASAQVIPGFNAEASIYVSLATYRSSGSSGGRLGAVQPQLGGPNCHRVNQCVYFCCTYRGCEYIDFC
jgi:hypothetical protein